jgi:hypothetical protein
MTLTEREARAAIQRAYGPDFKFRLTTNCTIGVRPVYQMNVGMHTLAWRKLATGKNSAVKIGRVMSGGAIDWDYVVQS